jgi:hypothetical protein
MNTETGVELTATASLHSSISSASPISLFPLPLATPPPTQRNSGHRRRRHQQASAVHSIANALVRALNTLHFNYPAVHTALSLRSADPSSAQSRLTDSLLNAAAVYYNASRQWFGSTALTAAGVTPGGGVSGEATLIPGCSLQVPRPWVQAMSSSMMSINMSVLSAPSLSSGASLFIFDESAVSSTDSVTAAMPDTYAVNAKYVQHPYGSVFDTHYAALRLLDSLSPSSGRDETLGYTGDLPKGLVSLIAKQVSLPSTLNNVPLKSLLPPTLSSLYNSPASLLLPLDLAQRNLAAAALRRPRVLAGRSEYTALVARMHSLGMLSMTTAPMCVNGLFGVPKGDKIRLILDARPANCYFVRPPHVTLPSPSHLAALRIPQGRPLYVAKMDLSNFYHQLTLPEWMRPYFALPPLTAAEIGALPAAALSAEVRQAIAAGLPVYPCCATLPMGWSHSVFVAQSVHEHVMYRHGVLHPSDNVVCLESPVVDRPLHALYIDDNILVGTEEEQLTQLCDRVNAAYVEALLPPNAAKAVRPTLDMVTTLGVDIDGRRGTISLNPGKQLAIMMATQRLLCSRAVSGRQLSAVVGSWTWPMLLRRPTLAAFKHVYTFIQRYPEESRTLWPCVRRELLVAMALAPLLRCSLRMQSWPKLLATDASMVGSGVVFTRLTLGVESTLWPLMTQPECSLLPAGPPPDAQPRSDATNLGPVLVAQQPVAVHRTTTMNVELRRLAVTELLSSPTLRWSTVLSSSWRRPQHINELEFVSLLLSIRWVLSHPDACHRQLHVLVDSSSVYFGTRKGRSSSPAMLALLRRYAALLLASGLTVLTGWIPSALNPADQASRKYVKRCRQWPDE